jgi:GntR family transcriptional regulator, uxu operon transcriptional repressor
MSTLPSQPWRSSYNQDLASQILARYQARAGGPRERLPTERRLAEELGVTRTVVRNALAVLEAEGRVSREVGRGTFMLAADAARAEANAVDPLRVSPADVMAARRLLEPQLLPLVVAWATPRDLDEMHRCVEGGAEADNYDEFESWDFALHHAIVAASRNQLVLAMYAVIEEARHGSIWGNLKRRNDTRERRASYQADHEALVAALSARELGEAMDAMERHLSRVGANLLSAVESRRDEP